MSGWSVVDSNNQPCSQEQNTLRLLPDKGKKTQ